MNKAQRVLGIAVVFGIVAAVAYWVYLFIVEGSAPSFGDLWAGAKGAAIGVTSVGKLSADEISVFAANAGWSGDDLATAVAVALAESSGNPAAVGDQAITPGGSVGLWQVNLKFHPEYTANELTDPQTNANAAFAVYRAAGNRFSPWTTFNTGAYQEYLPQSGGDQTASNQSDFGGEDA